MPTRIRTLLTGFAGGLCMLTIASIVAPTITSGQQAVGVGPERGFRFNDDSALRWARDAGLSVVARYRAALPSLVSCGWWWSRA